MICPLFIDYAARVLDLREAEGVRGIVSERSRFEIHLKPACFARTPLDEVSTKQAREWLRDMQAKPANDTRGARKLSTQTVARSKALASAVMTRAIEEELIQVNPFLSAKLRKRADEAVAKDKFAFLTLEEQKAFADCESLEEWMRLAIMFAVYTGVRQGEQFNLELRDLHVDGDFPHVTVRFGSKGKPPKSGKIREVPLLPQAVEVCKRWLELLPSYCPDNPDKLVFPTPHGTRRGVGKPLGRICVNGEWIDAWKHAKRTVGLARRFRWHDLRHTCASSLVAGFWGRRWSSEEIKEVLGHSSIVITQKYAHLGASSLKEAARATVIAPIETAKPANDLLQNVRAIIDSGLQRTMLWVNQRLGRAA